LAELVNPTPGNHIEHVDSKIGTSRRPEAAATCGTHDEATHGAVEGVAND